MLTPQVTTIIRKKNIIKNKKNTKKYGELDQNPYVNKKGS